VALPLFPVSSDPGPSFQNLLKQLNIPLNVPGATDDPIHATTVVALRCDDGVVVVADRQATGQAIAARDMRKIAEADRYTAIAISGTAAAGMEFIRISQLSFEHYEKMMDETLSLEGKSNYLSSLIQDVNLGTPFTVLPLVAGYDINHNKGRVFEYDGAGGCYEKDDFGVIGSGTPFAESALRLGYRDGMSLSDCVELGALAIYEAGDNDPYTGGPDFVRGIFPIVVTVTANGFVELPETETRAIFEVINARRTASKGRAGGDLR
jgi:proteasome beta subunit